VTITGEDVDQVTQTGATVSQSETPDCVYDDDALELSGGKFKRHEWATLRSPRGIICLIFVFNNRECNKAWSGFIRGPAATAEDTEDHRKVVIGSESRFRESWP